MYTGMYAYVRVHTYICIYTYTFIYAYISEMNDSNDTKDKMEDLGLFCYYKIIKLLKL